MSALENSKRNWFQGGGRSYAAFRPEYPYSLSTFLAETASGHGTAVDVGCGTGQLTTQLAGYFASVVGVDPSADQIANAATHDRVIYRTGPAEHLPVETRSANLITAAQAAHWFDLPRFYGEVRRIGRENALVALISYGVLQLGSAELNERFNQFYWQDISPYWPPERKLVDTGYADIPFPFTEFPAPEFFIDRAWELGDFLGYLSTWSATQRAIEAGRQNILETFVTDLSRLWGARERKQPVIWPINIRLGRL